MTRSTVTRHTTTVTAMHGTSLEDHQPARSRATSVSSGAPPLLDDAPQSRQGARRRRRRAGTPSGATASHPALPPPAPSSTAATASHARTWRHARVCLCVTPGRSASSTRPVVPYAAFTPTHLRVLSTDTEYDFWRVYQGGTVASVYNDVVQKAVTDAQRGFSSATFACGHARQVRCERQRARERVTAPPPL